MSYKSPDVKCTATRAQTASPSWTLQLGTALFLLAVVALSLRYAWPLTGWGSDRGLWISLSVIGLWRWGWGFVHVVRAVIYRYWYYPRLKRKVMGIDPATWPIPELAVLATTYHEHAWITTDVVKSVVHELSRVTGLKAPPQLIFVTGGEDDDQIVTKIFDEALLELEGVATGCHWPPQLTLLRGDQGKRPAIAAGLKTLAQRGLDKQGVVLLMDGDTALVPGALSALLPIFRVNSNVGAATTNERAFLQAPSWFREWITLRFGQRHLYMCSVSLSRRLLCLTGRLSAFRADIATNPTFIQQIENDHLTHWLFGPYRMFSGDDKSTWYWLAKHGYDLLYVPDAMAITYEVVTNQPWQRVVANMKRWSGNMLRNSSRAMALGPRRLGLFPWLCVVDQQVSMWTVLIGPVAMMIAAFNGRWEFIAAYTLWLIVTRTARVGAAWVHGRRISLIYIPLQLMSEWLGAVVKIWVYFHPVKQTWLNRGNRTLDSTAQVSLRRTRQGLANYYYAISYLCFVLLVGAYTGLLPLSRDLGLMIRDLQHRDTHHTSTDQVGQPRWSETSLIDSSAVH